MDAHVSIRKPKSSPTSGPNLASIRPGVVVVRVAECPAVNEGNTHRVPIAVTDSAITVTDSWQGAGSKEEVKAHRMVVSAGPGA